MVVENNSCIQDTGKNGMNRAGAPRNELSCRITDLQYRVFLVLGSRYNLQCVTATQFNSGKFPPVDPMGILTAGAPLPDFASKRVPLGVHNQLDVVHWMSWIVTCWRHEVSLLST